MDEWVCQLLDSEPRGFLATCNDDVPHVVPVVFVRLDDRIYSPIDGKPKSTARLRRVRNIEQNCRVSLILDHYDEDWKKLWWLRLDCQASVVPSSCDIADLLLEKYPQYQSVAVGSSAIEMTNIHWQSWSMAGSRNGVAMD